MVNKKKLILFLVFSLFCINIYAQESLNVDEKSTVLNESEILLNNDNENQIIQTENTRNGPSTAGLLFRLILVLIIVIGIIYGVFWFIKKKTNIVKTDDDFLRRVAFINIAPGKTIEVITLIDKAYLIGVTEDNITLLGEIDDKELINAMNVNADRNQNIKKPLNFSEVLDIFTSKNKSKVNIFSESENRIDELYKNGENSNNENV